MNEVWIDTDMGFDDLAAILTVQAAAGWRIAGLSLVAGNAPLEVVMDNAARAAACFGWMFPIHSGRDHPLCGPLVTAQSILGADAMASAGRSLPSARAPLTSHDAVMALANHLQAAPTPVTVLALGPLTNLATLIHAAPELARRIGRLVWMGGSAGPGNHTAAAEFNAAVDPEAAQRVIDAGIPLEMVELQTCRQARVTPADAHAIAGAGTAQALMLADLLLGYIRIAGPGPDAAQPLYDPAAAVALVEPGAVAFRPARVDVECEGRHTRGMTVVEWRVPRRARPNALVSVSADAARVRACVLNALRHGVPARSDTRPATTTCPHP